MLLSILKFRIIKYEFSTFKSKLMRHKHTDEYTDLIKTIISRGEAFAFEQIKFSQQKEKEIGRISIAIPRTRRSTRKFYQLHCPPLAFKR